MSNFIACGGTLRYRVQLCQNTAWVYTMSAADLTLAVDLTPEAGDEPAPKKSKKDQSMKDLHASMKDLPQVGSAAPPSKSQSSPRCDLPPMRHRRASPHPSHPTIPTSPRRTSPCPRRTLRSRASPTPSWDCQWRRTSMVRRGNSSRLTHVPLVNTSCLTHVPLVNTSCLTHVPLVNTSCLTHAPLRQAKSSRGPSSRTSTPTSESCTYALTRLDGP